METRLTASRVANPRQSSTIQHLFTRAAPGFILLVVATLACGPSGTAGVPTANPNEPTKATPPAEGTPFRLLTPGPTVPAGHWRWKGRVIDKDDKPLAGVCVHIGPGDCQFNSIRTDDDGRWVIDFPQVDVIYQFHFVKDGLQRVDQDIRTTGPGDFEVRMIPK
jgi:hypothetical protein